MKIIIMALAQSEAHQQLWCHVWFWACHSQRKIPDSWPRQLATILEIHFLMEYILEPKTRKNPPTTTKQVFIRKEVTCLSSQRKRGIFKHLQCDSIAFHSSARSASCLSDTNIQILAAIIPAKEVFGCREDSPLIGGRIATEGKLLRTKDNANTRNAAHK